MKVGLIGAGLIGHKRAEALSRIEGMELEYVCDTDQTKAKACAEKYGGHPVEKWEDVVQSDVSLVIVATYHNVAIPIVLACLESGKHVLCEKPLGRTSEECLKVIKVAEKSKKLIKTGFNYRHYPGFRKAYQLVQGGAVGDIQYIRSVLGHAARPDYDKEWRTDATQGGGGALLDPGIHLIDLLRYFLGDFSSCMAIRQNAFWNIAFEDNIFLLLKTKTGKSAFMQSSITEWKNNLSFEIIGTDGYIKIFGRGGFYGPQRIVWNKRWAWLGEKDPSEQEQFFSDEDVSFREELKEFQRAILEDRQPLGSGYDALYAAKVIDAIYNQKESGEIRLS